MGVRTAERITGVSIPSLRINSEYIGCGRHALRCKQEASQSAEKRHHYLVPSSAFLWQLCVFNPEFEGALSLVLFPFVNSQHPRCSPDVHRRWRRTIPAPQCSATGSTRRAAPDGESDDSSPRPG